MSEGFVYVLVSANCQFIKIGKTEKPPFLRIKEINSSDNYSGAGPWELSDFRHVHDCHLMEKYLHTKFSDRRANIGTGADELFDVSPSIARDFLESLDPNLLVSKEPVDRLFGDRDFSAYLQQLFACTGLSAWLSLQGAWTFALYPNTAGGRFFTINIGRHEVAYSAIPKGQDALPRHCIVLDKLILDFPKVKQWACDREGDLENAPYSSALPRAISMHFSCEFSEAQNVFKLDGVRRALIAYWTEALIGLRERGVMSPYARYHNYNAVALLIERLRHFQGYLYDGLANRG